MVKRVMKKCMAFVGTGLGYDLKLISRKKFMTNGKTKINIGAGNWERKGWINLDYPSESYAKVQQKHDFIPYDIRNDKLPFSDNSIDVAYCSHVVEHIEDSYVREMFRECYRTLKTGGVLRICCPDADFLYNISKCGKGYWEWMRYWFDQRNLNFDEIRAVDCLVAEVCTPKLLNYGWLNYQIDYGDAFNKMDKKEFLEFITKDTPYNNKYTNNHINYWTYDKMAEYLKDAGFSQVILSKYGSSYCYEMQNICVFDTTHPEMSLYVEAIK